MWIYHYGTRWMHNRWWLKAKRIHLCKGTTFIFKHVKTRKHHRNLNPRGLDWMVFLLYNSVFKRVLRPLFLFGIWTQKKRNANFKMKKLKGNVSELISLILYRLWKHLITNSFRFIGFKCLVPYESLNLYSKTEIYLFHVALTRKKHNIEVLNPLCCAF